MSQLIQVVVTRLGGPEGIAVKLSGEIGLPAAGQIRVSVEASSISSTDTLLRKGLYPPKLARPPFVLGYDLVGRVNAVGPGVDNVWLGQRVAALVQTGGHSSSVILPVSSLIELHTDLPSETVAALMVSWVAALQMLRRCRRLDATHRVLIHGASGAVGGALVALSKLGQSQVVASCSTMKMGKVIASGADVVLPYDATEFWRRVRASSKTGFDVVFDATGLSSVCHSFGVLRRGGTLVAYGTHALGRRLRRRTVWALCEMGVHFAALLIWLRLMRWLKPGTRTAFFGIFDAYRSTPKEYAADLHQLFKLTSRGKIKVDYQTIDANGVERTHRAMDCGEAVGQYVLSFKEH